MNEITTIDHPIGGEVATRPSGAMSSTDQHRAIAEVQAAMVIARANPRNERGAIDRILNACQRQRLAEVAVYSYARGGSNITGPSIRLAEAVAQNWGNLQFGIREIEQRQGESVVQAFAWDVETNVRREMTFTVPHLRHTKKGAYRLTDPRDIYEMVANNGARRLRSCILAVVPGDVIDIAVEQCEETMRAKADISSAGQQKMVQAFLEFGVVQQQLEARIQRRLDAIQPAQMVALKKIYASLRDGMSSTADWFDPMADDDTQDAGSAAVEPAKGNAGAKEALRRRAVVAKESDDSRYLDAGSDQGEPDEGEPEPDPKAQALATIKAQIAAAKNERGLKAVDAEWQKIAAVYDDADERAVDDLLRERRAALRAPSGEGK